jgi:Rod binding domain-containing protein
MEISPLQRRVQAADQSLESLAHNPTLTEGEKIAEVSRQFEAVLIRQILSEAQKSGFKTSLSQNSATSSIYQDLVTSQLAQSISHSHGLGLGETLTRQLSGQFKLDETLSD